MNAYDFDETIYDGESAIDFIISYFKEDPSIIKYVPDIIAALIKYKRGLISLDDFKHKYGEELKEYFTTHSTDLEKLVREFWDKRMHKIKPFYKTLQRTDDVIITACPSFVMNEICKRLGIKNLVATEVDLSTGEIKKACFREGKIECFREAFPDAVIEDFYTDSMNDKFMFPFAKRVFMVKGNKITQIK